MTFGSLTYTKADYAATLAATLAQFLYLQGDAVGLLTFDERLRDFLPARHRTGLLRSIMLALEKPAEGSSTDVVAALRRATETIRKRGLIVLVSDFLAPLADVQKQLVSLSACGHDLILFQVLDPAETTFNFPHSAMFEDAETGRAFFINPASARTEYLRRLESHCGHLRSLCQRLGVAYSRMPTDRPLELALFDFLRGRMQLRHRVRRVVQHSSRSQS